MPAVAHSLKEALRHHHAGDLHQAEKLYREIVRIDPGHADALHLLGVTAHQCHDHQTAIEYIQRAIAVHANFAAYHCNLGAAYRSLQRTEEAVSCFREAIRLDPQYAGAYYNLGMALEFLGNTGDAIESYRETVRLDPAFVDGYCHLGGLLAIENQFDEAVSCYQKAVSLRPDHLQSRCLLGKALEQLGRLDAALGVFQETAILHHESPDVHFDMGHVYLSRNDFENAQLCYERGLEIDSHSVPNWKNLGCIHHALGRHEEAEKCLRKAIQITPDYAPAHFYLGNVLIEQNRTVEAIESLRHALKLKPDYAEACSRLGKVLLHQAEFDEARSSFERALSLNPHDIESCIHLGHVLKKQGEIDEAEASYRRAVTLAPGQMLPHYALGRFLHSQGRLEEAEQSFRRAMEYEPGNAKLHYYLGNVYKEWGRFPEAIAGYRKAIQFDPEISGVHYELGNTFRHLQQYEQARECYEHVLTLDPDDFAALISLGNVLKTMDFLQESAACYRKVIERIPDRPYWKLWTATLCPMVFSSNEEIDEYRKQLQETLQQMAGTGSLLKQQEVSRYGCPPPYNLQFHGRDNRLLKEAYAHVFRDFVPQDRPPAGTGKPKIGFMVTNGHEGVFLRYLLGVLERMNPARFEIVILCSAAGRERMRPEIRSDSVQLCVMPHEFDQTLKAIRDFQFDVLYHWEVGSDVNNYFLPFFRPAPVQCTSLGVLETSGISQIDYYLSSNSIEPVEAESHYTETLIRARTLLSFQSRLQLPPSPRSREDFGFQSNQHIYLCPHKIQKFHPDFDPLLSAILQNDSQGILVIPKDISGFAARNLRARMEKTMSDVFSRVLFLPHQTLPDYLSLTAAADVLLDPIYYGGGITAYDGLSLNQPTITMPTRFARGRFTCGLYRQIGVTECTASTPEEYVQKAVRLGTESDYREVVAGKIRDRSEFLFEDMAIIEEYERIFQQLVDEARCG